MFPLAIWFLLLGLRRERGKNVTICLTHFFMDIFRYLENFFQVSTAYSTYALGESCLQLGY